MYLAAALFWRVAESFTEHEYRANIERVKNYDIRLYEAMMEKNPQNCSLAYFSPAASCVDVHNNISESFNNAIDPARYMPMVEMLETIRRRTMIRIDQRMKEALNHQGRFTVRAVEWIEDEQKKLRYCVMVPGANARDEVRESGVSYSVNMRLRTCACRRWDMSGLPCRHALRIIAERKLNHEDHISHWFLNSRQQQIYGNSINPVNGMLFWGSSGSKVLPPPSLVEEIENRVGRKPKPKRKKARHESPSKKKASREKKVMHCGRCGEAGHNATKCQNMVGETSKKARKRTNARKKRQVEDGNEATETEQDGYESMTLSFEDGPIPTQPTQE
ncbi:uncharacterized protein LOC112088960 [Eutrema salsugineum]|uniref:uncharacterized protein LOC112088960 n=1 Tax=Eutrema salsugineum TaxID=72664 RepID=UPI000CED6B4D|nr:uncharacterized protein LOC112088960 [Eutrema salsugineum]